MQNFAARIMFDHVSDGSYFLKRVNVSEKILFNDLVSVFKCLNRSSTRRSGNLRLPRCRLSCRGFYFREAKRWNDLLKDLQSIKGIKLFKKDYLIVYLMNRLHEQEFLYLIYCLTVLNTLDSLAF